MEEEKVSDNFLSTLDSFQSKSNVKRKDNLTEKMQTSKRNSEPKKFSTATNVKDRQTYSNRVDNFSKSNLNVTKKNNERTNTKKLEKARNRSEERKDLEHTSNETPVSNRPNKSRNTEKPHKIMGYKFLEGLMEHESSSILTTLANSRSGFQELLNARPLRADLIVLIVNVLYRVKESEIHHLKAQVFSQVFSPEFIEEIKRFTGLICIEDNPTRLKPIEIFFKNIVSLLEMIINVFPSMMNEKLKSLMVALNISMKNAKDVQRLSVEECLFEQVKSITDQIDSYIEHSNKAGKKRQENSGNGSLVPNNFRDLPLVPVKNDFLNDKPFLRQNVVKGSYNNVEQYLDVHFRLIREDFIAPIRTGIYEYIEGLSSSHKIRKYSNVKIYPKVKFEIPFKCRDKFGFMINFDCDGKLPRNINWEFSKRFLSGSLLLFTDDQFQTFYLATVVERDIKCLQNKQLAVSFVPGTPTPEYIFEPGVFFVMAESEVYYEAYRHVLTALTRLNESNFPMKEYIVDVDIAGLPPAHLVNNSSYNISGFKFDVTHEDWPSPDELKLNASQHQALRTALTNEFVVIQGPPGTGKTFLALKITEILLKNEVSDTPIMVICYTNHALDQFLEGILKYTKSVIRIGSQSSNETIQEYNIDKVRKNKRFNSTRWIGGLLKETIYEKNNLSEKIQILKLKFEEINSLKGILKSSVLESVVIPQHLNELSGQEVEWLLCQDNPELLMSENDLQMVPTENEYQNSHNFENEDFEEEVLEDENTRRLDDMYDDYYEDNDVTEVNYASSVKYKLTIQDLYDELKYLRWNLEHLHECRLSYIEMAYFKVEAVNKINELDLQIKSLENLFFKFKDFKFNPERHNALKNRATIWEMTLQNRWEYYMGWIHLLGCQLNQIIQHVSSQYHNVLMKLYELKQLEDVEFVRDVDVIGLTTSGAAKRRVLLENLNCKIVSSDVFALVIVEEAAEVLEAHIVTSLTKNVQHVILIGDHKQLKPKPAVYQLAKKYNLEVSLFERMLKNGLGCSVLGVQHRMRPEIASLIVPTIYPTLANHPSTFNRPRVSGIDKFVFFLTHNNPEDQLPDSSSKQNTYEADFLIALCQHLLLQGYNPEEITILATYSGQVWCLRKEKRRLANQNSNWRNVRITPVDNFQGEENRIILLSLVRSNKENKIGFLSEENRVCVALSRAREGLYIVGNMENLTASSAIWPRIKQRLEEIGAIGSAMTLRCERHPEQLIQASTAQHFSKAPEGGCLLKCETQLECGHLCPRVCHIIDRYHTEYKCRQPCSRKPCEVDTHKCPLRCSVPCQPCEIKIIKLLPCGHSTSLPCYEEPASVKCKEPVPATLPSCGHQVMKPCFQDVKLSKCSEPCISRLPCGHACIKTCHVNEDPDHLEYKCNKDCTKPNTKCRRNHPCPKRCHEICGDCPIPIQVKLTCGHTPKIACSQDETQFRCEKDCTKILPCGHKCSLHCWMVCDSKTCVQKVNKQGACGHTFKNLKCNEETTSYKCYQNCVRKLPCGHPCSAKCWNDCTKVICQEQVESTLIPACGHSPLLIPCHLNTSVVEPGSDKLLQLCKEPCGAKLPCGHDCSGSCSSCMQGRLHMPCTQPCNKELVCGHKCKDTCNILCPPCKSKGCFTRCTHSKCNLKHGCRKPCNDICSRKCMWQCDHLKCTKPCGDECNRPPCDKPCTFKLECGHLCIGYCGETHPPLCRDCDEGHPIISASPRARFVLLEDCDCIIEGNQLAELMNTVTSKNGVTKFLRCPHCNKPIVKTMRCRNIYIRLRGQLEKIDHSVYQETNRLIHGVKRHLRYFQNQLMGSFAMKSLVEECVKNIDGNRGGLHDKLAPAVILNLLQPLITKYYDLEIDKLLSKKHEQMFWMKLDYLAQKLRLRHIHISYQDILQTELEVTRILRLLETPLRPDSVWYDTTPYTWEQDMNLLRLYNLKPIKKLSATLRTREANKQWFQCDSHHLYVSEGAEPCITCEEEAERHKNTENRVKQEQQERRKQESRLQEHLVNIPVTDFRRGWGRGGRGRGGTEGGGRGRGGRGRGGRGRGGRGRIPGMW